MKEPLMRIGKSQMRVPSNRSSEMRLHLNRVGTGANCNCDQDCAPDGFAGASHLAIDVEHQTAYALTASAKQGLKRHRHE